jgi:hypothetical protein
MHFSELSQILFFLLLSLISRIKARSIRNGSFCLIENINYKNEYLTSSFDYDLMNSQMNDSFKKRLVYISSIKSNSISYSQQLIWYLIEIKSNKNDQTYFYIMNPFFDLYLCASTNYQDRFHRRRRLNLDKTSTPNYQNQYNYNENNCLWQLVNVKQSELKENNYEIWNVKHKEPLYAASFLFKKTLSEKRNVYLWHDLPDSKQFSWNLKCN